MTCVPHLKPPMQPASRQGPRCGARRKGFPEVQQVTHRLMAALRKAGNAPVLLDKALLAITLDVIGRIGFAKDFGATAGFEALVDGGAPPPGPGASEGTFPAGCEALAAARAGCFSVTNTSVWPACRLPRPLFRSSLELAAGVPGGYAPRLL